MTNVSNGPPDARKGQTPPPARGTAPVKRGGSKKISRGLLALSATAILAVYSVGYAGTESAAANVASPVSTVTVLPQVPGSVTATPTVASVATAPVATATAGYKDGTYAGQGTSRHGGIQVQVRVQSGKIVSATITGSSTRYPTSAIASLPAAVVSQQSPNVDVVSGATDSSSAFIQAITSALAQAA